MLSHHHRGLLALAGTDRRKQFASRTYEPHPDIEEALEKRMAELIEKAHCQLLEQATLGRLTWQGDKIVKASKPRENSPSTSRSAFLVGQVSHLSFGCRRKEGIGLADRRRAGRTSH